MGPKLTQAEGFILGVGAKMFSCCGARRMSSAAVRLRPSPTAATRSGRFIRHWRRSHRSPSPAL